jgi:2-oxoglutarate ferredoxin oxidoreductase subunit gamma
MTTEIRLSGSGGQGIILAGEVLAEAMALHEGKNVSLSTSYGGQVRGGSSRCDILFCEESQEIDFPEVTQADILLAMTEEALLESVALVKEEGVVVTDATYIKGKVESKGRVYSYPLTLTAKEKLGTNQVANILALGMIAQITGVVKQASLKEALIKKIPASVKEANQAALLLGFELGKGIV